MKAKVSAKGWVVIPAPLRRRYGLRPGTSVEFHAVGGKIVMTADATDPIDELYGKLAGEPSLTVSLLESRARDRKREETDLCD